MAQAFLPAHGALGRGSFITVGSVADHVGFPENAAYAASKYGLRGLHETLVARNTAAPACRLTLVSPGPTDTSVWDPFDPDRREGSFPGRRCCARRMWPKRSLFVATRPAHVLIDWLRLGPTGKSLATDERR